MPSSPMTFDANGLYILLTDIGSEIQFHWAFYLATSSSSGVIFQLINTVETGDTWQYQTKDSIGVPSSTNLLVGVKIAILDPLLHGPLGERLAQVSTGRSDRYGDITCRVWLKEALHELDDEGYIQLVKSVDFIEDEALMAAVENRPRNIRSVIKSSGSTV
jgi:hypothetical protein